MSGTAPVHMEHVGDDDHVGWEQLNHSKYFLYSGAFILAFDALIYPIDLLKTRQQFDISPKSAVPSIRAIFNTVYNQEGLRGLYRGVVANAVGGVPGSLLYFASYEYTKSVLESRLISTSSHHHKQSYRDMWIVNLTAGFVGDAISLLIYTPADIVSQRMMVATQQRQVDVHAPDRSQRLPEIIRSILKHEGPIGFYRGFWGALATYAPSSAIWFATYEALKSELYVKVEGSRTPNLTSDDGSTGATAARQPDADPMPGVAPTSVWLRTVVHLVAGAGAGLASVIVTNPLDVAKTRQQTMDINNPHDARLLRRGFWSIFYWTLRSEGVRGLYRGFLPRLWFSVVGSALTFAGYEAAKRLAIQPV